MTEREQKEFVYSTRQIMESARKIIDKKDPRRILHCVNWNAGKGVIEFTNGRVLLSVEGLQFDGLKAACFEPVVFPPPIPKRLDFDVDSEKCDTEPTSIHFSNDETTISQQYAEASCGVFPDTENIFPSGEPTIEVTFTTDEILRLAKGLKALGVEQFKLEGYADNQYMNVFYGGERIGMFASCVTREEEEKPAEEPEEDNDPTPDMFSGVADEVAKQINNGAPDSNGVTVTATVSHAAKE